MSRRAPGGNTPGRTGVLYVASDAVERNARHPLDGARIVQVEALQSVTTSTSSQTKETRKSQLHNDATANKRRLTKSKHVSVPIMITQIQLGLWRIKDLSTTATRRYASTITPKSAPYNVRPD